MVIRHIFKRLKKQTTLMEGFFERALIPVPLQVPSSVADTSRVESQLSGRVLA